MTEAEIYAYLEARPDFEGPLKGDDIAVAREMEKLGTLRFVVDNLLLTVVQLTSKP